ncbi:beta strand repeat-containing protein [Haloarcula salina]|uniref:beta strand repeat-containing protein n=1 Tax=Haloarcula salina TaxID=1429914 RepID=UPI001F508B85|nr:hypothetical protein [Haloarcula salina]
MSNYISNGEGDYTIHVIEEGNGDGNDDTSYAVSDPSTFYDTSATLTVDDTAPTITSSTTADSDNNGKIDAIDLTFSEDVENVNAGDYSVNGYTIDSVDDAGDQDASTYTLNLVESGSLDTGVTPEVSYTQGTTADLAGNLLANGAKSTPADGANPVVNTVTVTPDPVTDSDTGSSVSVEITFSESMSSVDTVTLNNLQQGSVTVSQDSLDSDTWTGTSATINDNNEDVTGTVDLAGASDGSNALSGDTSFEFTVDTKSPSVSTNFPSDGVIGGTVDVTGLFSDSAADATTTYEYSTDGGQSYTKISSPKQWDSTAVADGDITLKATETDDVDNSDTASGTITVDNTAPADVSVDSPTSLVVTKSTETVDVTYSYTETNPSSATIKLVNSSTGDTLTFNVDDSGYAGDNSDNTRTLDLDTADGTTDGNNAGGALVDGQNYTVELSLTDAGDNGGSASSPANIVSVDDSSPSSGSVTPGSDVTISDPTTETLQVGYAYTENYPDLAQIKLVDTDDGGTYTWDIQDNEYVDDGSTKTVTLDLTDFDSNSKGADDTQVEDSTYQIQVVAEDQAGNSDTFTTSSDNVQVDSTAPAFSGDSLDTSSTTPTFTIDINDDPAGSAVAGDTTGVDSASITLTATVDDGKDTEKVLLDGVTTDHAGVSWDANANTLSVDPASAGISYTEDSDIRFDVSADDTAGNSGSTNVEYTIRSATPSMTTEADAGDDTVTVTFSEPVSAADGTLSADDFSYQDVNNGGATAIDEVVSTTPALDEDGDNIANDGIKKATLRLDDDIVSNDLDADLVGARENAIEDFDDSGTYVGTAGVVVQDTTSPSTPTVSDNVINSNNAGSYTVTVNLGVTEPGSVKVTLNDPGSSDTRTKSATVAAGQSSVDVGTFDTSTFADGQVTVDVTRTDAGGNTASNSVTETKDTDVPSITAAEADAGTDFVYVKFDEDVTNTLGSDFGVTDADGNTITVDNVYEIDNGDTVTYRLTVGSDLTAADIGDATVSAPGVTDNAGNSVDNTVTVEDDDTIQFTGVEAEANSTTVTVDFDEAAYANADATGDLTASNFAYTDANSGGASAIVSVDHTAGDTTATITLDADVASGDLGSDEIGVSADAVYDSEGNGVAETSYVLGDSVAPSVTMTVERGDSDSVLDITVDSSEQLDSLSVDITTDETTAPAGVFPSLTDESDTTLTLAENFSATQNEDGSFTYTGTYDAPRDGQYDLFATGSDAAGNTGSDFVNNEEVDESAPQITDAYITDADGGSTTIAVAFDEPVDATGTVDFTVGGSDATIVSETDGDNVVEISAPANFQTGDSPEVSYDSGVLVEAAGSDSSEGTAAVHTLKLDLSAGQNFVSIPAASGTLSASTLVDEIGADKVDNIMTYDQGTWKTYNPDKSDSKQDFSEIEGGQGYIVTLNSGAVADVNVNNVATGGSAAEATPGQQSLTEGWNLVGHWQEGAQPHGTALGTVNSVSGATPIYGQQGTGFQYQTVTGDFEPGNAYWVFVENDEVYTEAQYGS